MIVAISCKALIQDPIILWNYLYLSQLLANCNDAKECYDVNVNWIHY
jgi:hypothetical protein